MKSRNYQSEKIPITRDETKQKKNYTENIIKDDVSRLLIFVLEMLVVLAIILFLLCRGEKIYNSGRPISGNATFEGMDIQIHQKEYNDIILTFNNPTPVEMKIGGWSANKRACLTTTDGEYWYNFSEDFGFDIPAHGSVKKNISFSNVSGTYVNVKIDCIQTLPDGLPTFGKSAIVEIPIIYEDDAQIENSIFDFVDVDTWIMIFIGSSIVCMIFARIFANIMSPKKTVKVLVSRKHIIKTTHYHNNVPTGSSYTYYVTFTTDEAEEYKMHVSRRIYRQIYAGDVGVLIRKGMHFVAFHSLNKYGEQNITE